MYQLQVNSEHVGTESPRNIFWTSYTTVHCLILHLYRPNTSLFSQGINTWLTLYRCVKEVGHQTMHEPPLDQGDLPSYGKIISRELCVGTAMETHKVVHSHRLTR